MNLTRLGLVLAAIGAIPLVTLIAAPVNPNVALADLGFLSILGGALLICLGFLQRRRIPAERSNSIIVTGWGVTSVGLLAALSAFLLLNQTACGGACGLTNYYTPIYGGSLAAVVGLAAVILGRLRGR